jgi:hypothetical protein
MQPVVLEIATTGRTSRLLRSEEEPVPEPTLRTCEVRYGFPTTLALGSSVNRGNRPTLKNYRLSTFEMKKYKSNLRTVALTSYEE